MSENKTEVIDINAVPAVVQTKELDAGKNKAFQDAIKAGKKGGPGCFEHPGGLMKCQAVTGEQLQNCKRAQADFFADLLNKCALQYWFSTTFRAIHGVTIDEKGERTSGKPLPTSPRTGRKFWQDGDVIRYNADFVSTKTQHESGLTVREFNEVVDAVESTISLLPPGVELSDDDIAGMIDKKVEMKLAEKKAAKKQK